MVPPSAETKRKASAVWLRSLPFPRAPPVVVGGPRFEYGTEASNEPVVASEAQPMDDGSGMFMGQAQFPQVGTWWLRLEVGKGNSQADVQFTFYVEPAQ